MASCLLVANWKMHGMHADAHKLVDDYARLEQEGGVEVVFALPATLLHFVAAVNMTKIGLAGQDCHFEHCGAHTGDISGRQLKDAGASYVILGHSERRQNHGESDHIVSKKAHTAIGAGLIPIICIGETAKQRACGLTFDVLSKQIDYSFPKEMTKFVLAYEPVWAIGSGQTPEFGDIERTHNFIREKLCEHFTTDIAMDTRFLYGGSVTKENAPEIFARQNVNGALVGGASLKSEDFFPIINALQEKYI